MREICLEGELYIHEEDHLEVVRKLEKENDGLVKEMKIKDSAARDALAEKDDPLKISEELNKKGFTVVPLDQWLMVNEQIAALKDELADELADYIMLKRDYEDASRLLVEAREQIAALTAGNETEQGEPQSYEDDGCPKENVVLRKEWRKLTAENKRLREGLLDVKWRLHNPYGAFLYDAAKKDNCRNCIHMLPATLPSAIDRISCKYADGWPHWSTKCNKWEKEQALRGGEVK